MPWHPFPNAMLVDGVDRPAKHTLSDVKLPTPDIFVQSINRDITGQQSQSLDIDAMSALLFQDLAGTELVGILRNDMVRGKNIHYKPVANLAEINLRFNPNNILKLQDASSQYFNSLSINLSDYVPGEGYGPYGNIVYMDSKNNIVIDVVNIKDFQSVEIEFQEPNSIFSDTIY